jgi:hypothetical protein
LIYADRLSISCNSNEGLQSFQLQDSGATAWYVYKCCSLVLTQYPTVSPSAIPSSLSTVVPTALPSALNTNSPTSVVPTILPTIAPTSTTTTSPSSTQSQLPTTSTSPPTVFGSIGSQIASFTSSSKSYSGNGNAYDVADITVGCNSGFALQSFQLHNDGSSGGNVYYTGSCGSANTVGTAATSVTTPSTESNVNLIYLDRQNQIDCLAGNFISSFQMVYNAGSSSWQYQISCVTFSPAAVATTCRTVTGSAQGIDSTGNPNLIYADRLSISCNSNEGLQSFQYRTVEQQLGMFTNAVR